MTLEQAVFLLQALLAILGFVSTIFLAAALFFGRRFLNNQDTLLAEHGKTLVVLERHTEQIRTLFNSSERQDRDIIRLSDQTSRGLPYRGKH